MYKYLFVVVLTTIILMSCSSSQQDEGTDNDDQGSKELQVTNLIDTQTVIEGSWISSAGTEREDESMVYTTKIDYNPANNYYLSHGAYVSYYEDDNFIKTSLHEGKEPISVQTVEEANSIVVSFRAAFIEAINLYESE